jgi:transcriptional regulator with XRE-family HTH domain
MKAGVQRGSGVGKIFGSNARGHRKARQLKQETVGHDIGCAKSTISEIESGTHSPNLDKAVALARYFGVPLDAMISEDKVLASPWLAKVRHLALTLPTEHQVTVAEMLEALAAELRLLSTTNCAFCHFAEILPALSAMN